jgi:hypothetical protein
MIPRITSFEPMADYKLLVNFDGGGLLFTMSGMIYGRLKLLKI